MSPYEVANNLLQTPSLKRILALTMSIPSVTLIYFNNPGRAFGIRVCLAVAHSLGKVKYTDERIAFADFGKLKPDLPLGSLPVLRFDDTGETMCQSIVLGRWASEKAGMTPKDDKLALRVEEVSESLNECWSATPFGGDKETLQTRREEWMKKTEAKFLPYFEKRLAEKGGPFFCGRDLSVADLWVYTFTTMVENGFYDHVPKDWLTGGTYPGLKALTEAVRAHPVVVEHGK